MPCPGEVCDPRARHDIQRTTAAQWLVLAATVAVVVAMAFAFAETFSAPARPLFPQGRAPRRRRECGLASAPGSRLQEN